MTIWLLAVLVIVVASCIQSVTGFGFGLTAVPVLTALYGTRNGIVLILMMSTATNLLVAWHTRRDAVNALVRPLALGGLLGLVPGIAAYYLLPAQALRLAIGAVLVGAVVVRLFGTRLVLPHSRTASVAVGASSGIFQGSVSLGGPPVSLYLSGSEMDKTAHRATIAKYLFMVNMVNLPAHLVGVAPREWPVIGVAATAALFIPVGAALGQFLFARMNQVLFERLVLGIIVLAVLTAVYQGASIPGLHI